jgi:hypothetical protein
MLLRVEPRHAKWEYDLTVVLNLLVLQR